MPNTRFALLAACLFLIWTGPLPAQRLSPLAPPPDWSALEAFQGTMTRGEFTDLLHTVYAPGDAAKGMIEIGPESASIATSLTPLKQWTLWFASDGQSERQPQRFWRATESLPPAPSGKPLDSVRIAIDPGHLGGEWAVMEERFLKLGEGKPVAEGDMTLLTAKLLAPKLEAMGAKVTLVRTAPGPVTQQRPPDLDGVARSELERLGVPNPRDKYTDPFDSEKGTTVQAESELLFYRTSEIRKRAQIVNDQIKPDLTICLHYNAAPWGDPRRPTLTTENHLHLIINGRYLQPELRYDDVRFDMLQKLLSRCYPESLAISREVAASMAAATGLPPYTYHTPNAINVGGDPYLWARNLLANRLYECPVIYIEPYVMNSQEIWDRVQAGDYEGERMVAGKLRKSLYREYADGVAEGLRQYYREERKAAETR